MGYLCPVCDEPFGDGEACANHLAVTAILHGESHDEWLSETVSDWESVPRAELVETVTDHAEETTDHDHPGDHTHPVGENVKNTEQAGQATHGQPAITESNAERAQMDAEAQQILSEARALTEKMQQRGPDNDGQKSPDSNTQESSNSDTQQSPDATDERKES